LVFIYIRNGRYLLHVLHFVPLVAAAAVGGAADPLADDCAGVTFVAVVVGVLDDGGAAAAAGADAEVNDAVAAAAAAAGAGTVGVDFV
jgi:hypothetical protein